MPIKRFMVPTINVGATCTNCLHRHEPSTFKRCTQCREKAVPDNHFPMHQTDEVEHD